MEYFFNFFSGVKRHLSIYTKTLAFFSCVGDAQELLHNLRKICDERAKAVLKSMEHLFSFVSSVADNGVLFGLILLTDYSIYKTAKMIKDTAALFRNIFAICVFAMVLKKSKAISANRNATNNTTMQKETAKKAKKCIEAISVSSQNEEHVNIGGIYYKGIIYDIVAASIHIVSLVSVLGLIPVHCKLAVCILDITRFAIKLYKHLMNIEKA